MQEAVSHPHTWVEDDIYPGLKWRKLFLFSILIPILRPFGANMLAKLFLCHPNGWYKTVGVYASVCRTCVWIAEQLDCRSQGSHKSAEE